VEGIEVDLTYSSGGNGLLEETAAKSTEIGRCGRSTLSVWAHVCLSMCLQQDLIVDSIRPELAVSIHSTLFAELTRALTQPFIIPFSSSVSSLIVSETLASFSSAGSGSFTSASFHFIGPAKTYFVLRGKSLYQDHPFSEPGHTALRIFRPDTGIFATLEQGGRHGFQHGRWGAVGR
jgi:hypothetical protein